MKEARMHAAWDAIVIGAGPAGMTAAATLAEGGARTLLVDEQAEPGGQIYRAVERNAASPLIPLLGKDYAAGRALVARFRASGAEFSPSASVWRAEPDGEVWTRSPTGTARQAARALLIATGAMERPVPVAGWTLPGVTTIGALQILLKSAGLRPAGRTVLAGSGPLFYLFATQCVAAGVEDLVLLDTAPAGNLGAALPFLPGALRGHGPPTS